MNARSLFVALCCISCVFCYGPLFVMSKESGDEEYYGAAVTIEDVEEIIKGQELEVARIIFNMTEGLSVATVESYVNQFQSRKIISHFIGDLNITEATYVNSVEELEKVPVENKLVVLELRQGEEYVAPAKANMDEYNGRGVYMTPSVMMALIVVVTLAYGLYLAVVCIDQVQTPTAYTHDALAVGKEF